MVLWNPDNRAVALRKSQDQYKGHVVPHFILMLWEFAGLLPYPFQPCNSSATLSAVKWLLRLWCLIILLIYLVFFVIEITTFTRVFRMDLDDLEFFVLVNFIYREFFFLLPVLILINLAWKGPAIPPLLHEMDEAIKGQFSKSQVAIIRMFHYVSWLFISLVMAASVFCVYYGIVQMKTIMSEIAAPARITWDSDQPSPLLGGNMSLRTTVIIYSVAFPYATICWFAPHFLLSGIVLTMGLAYRNLNHNLRNLQSHNDVEVTGCIIQRVRNAKMEHRILRNVLNDVNAVFNNVVLLATLGDVIISVALISRVLRKNDSHEESMDKISFSLQDETQKYSTLFFSICAIVEGILRVLLMVWMHEQVRIQIEYE